MKIDVLVSFNDIKIDKNESFRGKTLKAIDCFTQLILLSKSIEDISKLDEHTYEIYAFHSKPLEEEKKKILESIGINVMFDPENFIDDRTSNRITVFKHKTDGDYCLSLDTDTAFIKPPSFNFNKDIVMKRWNYHTISKQKYEDYYNICGVDPSNLPHLKYNNGVVLFKNDQGLKDHLYDKHYEFKSKLFVPELLEDGGRFRHFIVEIIMGIVYNTVENRGNFDTSINNGDFDKASIFHYYGKEKNIENINKLLYKYAIQ
jgi:hypothetical protein